MKKFLSLLALVLSLSVFSQSERYWFPVNEKEIRASGKRQIVPQKYQTFRINEEEFKNKLFSSPHEKNVKVNESSWVILLPVPNGQIQQFRIVESSMMEPGLAQQFPGIKTFNVKGIDDVYANGKLDWNEFGFHGMIRSVNGDFFIDPYCVGNTTDYMSYYKEDFVKDPSQIIPEGAPIENVKKN